MKEQQYFTVSSSDMQRFVTVNGVLCGQTVKYLIDSGASHNFMG